MTTLLNPAQLRVLGSLIEKEATVPDTYPMTLNGLVGACNQKSSRDPVTSYSESEIRHILDELKVGGLVRFVHASHGARSTKFRHVVNEVFDVDNREMALLAVMFLRGPNTVNELRVRTERYCDFESNDEVHDLLETMGQRDQPLAFQMSRQIGQSQNRWMHLLGSQAIDESIPGSTPHPLSPIADQSTSRETNNAQDLLAIEVENLSARLARVETALADLGIELG